MYTHIYKYVFQYMKRAASDKFLLTAVDRSNNESMLDKKMYIYICLFVFIYIYVWFHLVKVDRSDKESMLDNYTHTCV